MKSIKTTWSIRVQVPSVPNFLIEDVVSGEQGKYPISDFPNDVLKEIGAAWTEKLIDMAEKMRRHRVREVKP